MDIYNIICFAFTFAALFEFVLINFIGMFVQRFVCITFILIIIGFFIRYHHKHKHILYHDHCVFFSFYIISYLLCP